MTFRKGAAAGSTVSSAVAEYYLTDTVLRETMRAAEYYSGRQEHADSFWHREVIDGQLEMGAHRAELRADLSPALAARLGLYGAPTKSPLLDWRDPHDAEADDLARGLLRAITTALSTTDPKSQAAILERDVGIAIRDLGSLRGDSSPLARDLLRAITDAMTASKLEPALIEGTGAALRLHAARQPPAQQQTHGPLLPLTQERVANLLSGLQADGIRVEGRQIHRPTAAGKRPPVGFIDLTFSASKSLSVAWALAPDPQERDQLLGIHRSAVAKTMAYVAQEIGFTQRGGKRNRQSVPGEIAWVGFQHYTSRPVDGQAADPNLHSHVIVLNHAMTERGEVGALDLARLNGRVKEFGAVYEAHVAAEARHLGAAVHFDERRETAQLSDIPAEINDLFSKRSQQALEKGMELAEKLGLDWGELSEERRAGLEKAGAHQSRQSKGEERNDFASWSVQADEAGYRYKSVLGRVEIPDVSEGDRLSATYQAALPRLAEEFRRRAVLDEHELRRVAAQAFVTTGITDAASDLPAVMGSFRRDGIDYEGQRVSLVTQEVASVRGKDRVRVTTTLHVAQEQELIRLAKVAATDLSAALPPDKVESAVRKFLKLHPEIDPAGDVWRAQRGMIDYLASGGRLGVVIGVPGSGKSRGLAPLVQAWQDDGRSVYGISLAWRQAGDLRTAGIAERASLAAFLKRVETGRYQLDRNSIVVVDEVGLVGSRQMLELLRVQERTGAAMVMVGDPRQNQPIEGASGLELLRAALGEDAIPRLLKSVRQDSEREREIAALFRRGEAARALEMKLEDGSALLVSGGREATIERVAQLWRDRIEANRDAPAFTLTISAPTNADAREIGAAIRSEWRRLGHLGTDLATRRAVDRTGETYDITLAAGERLRLFDRIWDPTHHRALANNGEVVELLALRQDSMLVRNAAGTEGLVPWDKIRAHPDAPVRLAYGYALTVDTAQGSTATEHIHALPSGSQATHGFKTYTAATRHRTASWLVIDEASERRALEDRSMLGHREEITEPDIWKNIAANVARQPLKPSAISVLQSRA